MSLKKQPITYFFSLLCIYLCTFASVQAQFFEGGLFIGGSNYNGDLSGKFINPMMTRPAAGVLLRYNLSPRFTIKGFVGYGRIAGADSLSTVPFHQNRNLSFFTDIIEISGQIEINLIKYNLKRYAKRPFVPYLFTGIAVYNFDPKTNYAGTVYELQPLSTEGQQTTVYNDKERYALTQFAIPFGIGVKKRISERWTLGLELGARYTFTNYLDDVGGTYASPQVVATSNGEVAGLLSDRSREINGGVPLFSEGQARSNKGIDINDIYIFAGLTVTFRLKKKLHCPSFN